MSNQKNNTFKSYLKKYFIDAMGGMAQGLFASLLIGTIIGTIGDYIPVAAIKDFLTMIASVAKNDYVVGAAIGIGMARAMGAAPLVMYSSAVVGAGSYSIGLVLIKATQEMVGHYLPGITALTPEQMKLTAGPAGCFFAVILAVELGQLVSKKTKLDILVTPIVSIIPAMLLARWISPYIAWAMAALGEFINTATEYQPFWMGIVISAVVGVILTLPISSAAICAMIGISGIAGGAAVVGCCAQMVGFAVMSFRENRWGGLVSQGIGTSMLQMPNIVRNPRVWIPPIVASAITGPLATCVFGLKMYGAAINSGMGTCGFLGPIGIVIGWFGEDYANPAYANAAIGAMDWIGLVLICFLLPALISWGLGLVLRKIGWIKENDLKLQ